MLEAEKITRLVVDVLENSAIPYMLSLDRAYVEDWCRRLNIIDRYRQVIATVPIL